MFRSRRRAVVFPQHEHAALSAAIAAAWSDAFAPIHLPHERFVRGVAEHDRGYPEHDADEIGRAPRRRWLEIQERGFLPSGEDPVVDLVVALHVRRLVASHKDEGSRSLARTMDAALPGLVRAAGITPEAAAAADRITDLCDRISFDFCLEQAAAGGVDVVGPGDAAVRVTYAADGEGSIVLDPWPLAQPSVTGHVVAYAAGGYPETLEPVPTPFRIEPSRGSR